MMAGFHNFYSLLKSQDLVKKKEGAMCFEQVQRFILAKKIYWGLGYFKRREQ